MSYSLNQPVLRSFKDLDGVQIYNNSTYGATSLTSIVPNPTYRTSKRRWLVLFAVTIFGIANQVSESEGPILHTLMDLLDWSIDKYIYTGLLFTYLPLLTAIPSAWVIDKFGIKLGLYAAIIAMAIKTIFRILLFSPDLPNWNNLKPAYWIISNLLGTQITTIFYFTPLKVSESWFKESERSTAWAILTSATLVGHTIAGFSFPKLILVYSGIGPLLYVNVICFLVSAIVILFCITKSKPAHPPSERSLRSSNREEMSYIETIKKIVSHKDMILNCLHASYFDGVMIAVISVQQDILIASGHSVIFIGDLISINSIAGLVVLICLSCFVHRVKNIVFTCKLGSILKTALFIAYITSITFPIGKWLVITTSLSFATCRSWMSPNFNNMTAYLASGYLSEATTASLHVVLTVICITINQIAFMSLRSERDGQSDYTYSMTFSVSAALVNSIIYLLFFRGQQKTEQSCNRNTN